MASFRKVKNGYQATIYAGLKEDGTQDRRYATRPTLKECKAAAKEIERELEDKNFSNIGNIGVIAFINDWIETNKTRLSPSTHATYKLYSRVHYAPYFKKMKLREVEEIHIRKFMAKQLGFLSPTTVRKHISVLNKILREALRDKNPVKYVDLPSKAKYTPYPMTDFEFLKVHNAVKGTRDEMIVLLAAWCGLRRGEIFALKPNDVDWKKKTIRVDENTAINDEYDYVDKGPKSDNGYRDIVVPSYLMDLLEAYRKSWDSIPERLFDLRPDYYSSYFKEYIIDKHKELPPVRFHDLRHYHASWLYAKGIPDKYAAERLGHDIQTLKATYQHIGADRRQELDDTVRNLYDGQKKGKKWKLKRTLESGS
ncbi:site-specific integrase [Desulfosporosinus sp.]|uniref:tyrosine-type recombinase/integrase n=1 Tax=Desulfosporosinus sp. TaxID=157907 RepID=UPI0025BA8A5C|nr:site-specific integrase [Desulfosporosinus sp.]MBC2721808.1 site-specific integrase [Desulfosporosinus sp.]MBC2726287.1 site-specific integrase [Desulfosporosinus sp.]